jgi:hypothetical protein
MILGRKIIYFEGFCQIEKDRESNHSVKGGYERGQAFPCEGESFKQFGKRRKVRVRGDLLGTRGGKDPGGYF